MTSFSHIELFRIIIVIIPIDRKGAKGIVEVFVAFFSSIKIIEKNAEEKKDNVIAYIILSNPRSRVATKINFTSPPPIEFVR